MTLFRLWLRWLWAARMGAAAFVPPTAFMVPVDVSSLAPLLLSHFHSIARFGLASLSAAGMPPLPICLSALSLLLVQAQKRSSTFQCRVAATEKQDALSDRGGKTRLWNVELRRARIFIVKDGVGTQKRRSPSWKTGAMSVTASLGNGCQIFILLSRPSLRCGCGRLVRRWSGRFSRRRFCRSWLL